jgi:hypothetical protein
MKEKGRKYKKKIRHAKRKKKKAKITGVLKDKKLILYSHRTCPVYKWVSRRLEGKLWKYGSY